MKKALTLLLASCLTGLVSACSAPAGARSLRLGAAPPLGRAAVPGPVRARAVRDDGDDLAKKTQNPVSDLISLPLQTNFGFDYGKDNDTQVTLNIQPVIPVNMGDWNLLNRPILPVVYQPQPAPGTDDEFGLGDLTYTAWYSPQGGKLLWGLGGITQLPTHTDEALGLDAVGLGPSGVLVKMHGKWVFGGLMQNLWGVGGADRNDLNFFLAQYFVNYNLADGWYLTTSPIITANWEADSDERWTVPFGGGFGKVFRFGNLPPMNFNLQAFVNVENPDIGPEWSARFQLAFLFPKG